MIRGYSDLDESPETMVYIAERSGVMLGTATFTADAPQKLHADHAFPDETRWIRSECQHHILNLAMVSRIATAPSERGSTLVLEALVTLGLHHLEMTGVQRLLALFSPEDARYWAGYLGMATIAGPRPDPFTGNAPAMLLGGWVPDMVRHWNNTVR
jgi:hypothetical protein